MKELLKHIEVLYGISEVLAVERIEKGFLSENYKLLTSSLCYFLKKYRFSNVGRIREIHSAKEHFNRSISEVLMPIPRLNSESYFFYEGECFALFPFLDNVVHPERGELSEEMVAAMARMHAQMHLAGSESKVTLSKVYTGWDKSRTLTLIERLERKLLNFSNDAALNDRVIIDIRKKKELVLENSLKYSDITLDNDHLIHGDYHDQNIFFNAQNQVICIFDFERAMQGARSQELFRSATYSFFNSEYVEESTQTIERYIAAYNDVYPIGEKELKKGLMVHYLELLHDFWAEEEYYLKGNSRVAVFIEPGFERIKYVHSLLKRDSPMFRLS